MFEVTFVPADLGICGVDFEIFITDLDWVDTPGDLVLDECFDSCPSSKLRPPIYTPSIAYAYGSIVRAIILGFVHRMTIAYMP